MPSCCNPWQDVEVRRLVANRKGCRDRVRRLKLSKLILQAVSYAKRRYCIEKAKRILQKFRNLNRLDRIDNSLRLVMISNARLTLLQNC